MTTTEDLLNRVKALRNRARDEASSEAEAAAAMRRMEKLMEEHDISEADLAEGTITLADMTLVNVGRGTLHPTLYYTWYYLRTLTQTKILHYAPRGVMQVIGLEADREYAAYLIDLILGATERGWKAQWKARKKELGFTPTASYREKCKASYQMGMASGLIQTFEDMIEAREARQAAATGTALVVSKDAAIEEYIEKTFGGPVKKARKRKKIVTDRHSFSEGVATGQNTALNRPIEDQEEEKCRIS